MDLLGSILGKMDAPPVTASDKEALKKAKGIDRELNFRNTCKEQSPSYEQQM